MSDQGKDRLAEIAQDLRQQRDELLEALRKIAYEPFGHAEATAAEVLNDVTNFARETIAKATSAEQSGARS